MRDASAADAEQARRARERRVLADAFPASPAELARASTPPQGATTGVVVLGHGPVVTATGVELDDGPVCVPRDVPITVVAPPVVAASLERAWRDQAPWSGGTPVVTRAGSVGGAVEHGGVLVVVESTGRCWARRADRPGERVPFVPVLPAAGADR